MEKVSISDTITEEYLSVARLEEIKALITFMPDITSLKKPAKRSILANDRNPIL